MINPSDFIHPEDAAALRQLENIPGFPTLVKKVLELGLEPMCYGMNMASCIRLSPTQLPQLYTQPLADRRKVTKNRSYGIGLRIALSYN